MKTGTTSTRLVGLITAATLTAGLPAAAPALADPPPDEVRTYLLQVTTGGRLDQNLVLAGIFRFSQMDGTTAPPAGTRIHVSVSSCGQFLQQTEQVLDGSNDTVGLFFSPDGQPTYSENSVNRLVGTSIEYVIDITTPGYDAYQSAGSYSGYNAERPSCAQILSPGYGDEPTPITVPSWSVKKGVTTAKIGKTLKVTPTRAAGAKVDYAWKVGTKTVDTDRAIVVKKSYRGKRVTLRVTVTKVGAKTISKTLRYGPAR